jgi:phytoene desaturase
MANRQKIIVVGAGIGGLAAAIRLAAAGYQVQILEKNARAGGKVNLIKQDGFSFDTGPSLITMPAVLRELFAAGGARLDDELELVQLDPICRYWYRDGTRCDASTDLSRMVAEIARLDSRDVAGFLTFLAYARQLYTVAAEPFLFHPIGGPLDAFRRLVRGHYAWRDALRVLSPRSLDALVRRYFHSPYLRQLFDRYATYTGSSPYRTPAIYALIPYVEYTTGVWYVRGGIYMLVRALQRVAGRRGVALRTGCEVAQVIVRDGRACGVVLADGTALEADAVVVNADVVYTYHHLLASESRREYTRVALNQMEPSCSAFVLLLGVRRQYPHLEHHNIFFSADYSAEFRDIFVRRIPPRDPTIYVCRTTRTDPTQAPPGHDNLFVLVNTPYLSAACDWEREAPAYRELVLARLEQFGLDGLRRHLVTEQMITPQDLERLYHANRGAIYGLSVHGCLAPLRRPPNRARAMQRLYFVGGSTHPGGGLPLVALSGKIVADLVAQDIG